MYGDLETGAGEDFQTFGDHTLSTIPHHKRTHSASSTASSHMGGVQVKMLMIGRQSPSVIAENQVITVGSYTGSVTDRMGMLHPGSPSEQKGWFSSPSVSRSVQDEFGTCCDMMHAVFVHIICTLYAMQKCS